MRTVTSPAFSTCSKITRQTVLLAAFFMLINSFVQAQSSCSAFGNPPRGNVSVMQPLCGIGGSLLSGFNDSDGTPRSACLYPPSAPVAGVRYPMIVFIHASLSNADSVKLTPLFDDRNTVNISGGSTTGFIILAPQGRNTQHFYPFPDNQGQGWDNWYRQLSPDGDVTLNGTVFKENVDAATIDHFIQQQVATGLVDTDRIYLVGWSNGSAMSFLYGTNRDNIAAAAVYSAPDPFGAFDDPCQQTPVSGTPADTQYVRLFASGLPTFQLHNACDIAGICPNSRLIAPQLKAVGGSIELDEIIDAGLVVSSCNAACGTNPNGDPTNPLAASVGAANHVTWPILQTPQMLQFLQQHPLSSRPKP
jgi:hypothetical protein